MTVAGLLGSSDYAAQITTRGGGRVLGEMEWDSIAYARAANETSDATVRWFQGDAQVPAFLVQTEPWEHDLVIWRHDEPEPVFAGPVRTVKYATGETTVTAKDGTAWFEKRRIHTDTTYPNVDLAYIFGKIAGEALAQDPSPGLTIITAPCGVVGTRITRAAEAAVAADLLRELSRSGVDWTAVGRRVLIGGADLTVPLGVLILIDEAVQNPALEKAGDVTVTRQTMRWQAPNQEPMLTSVSSTQEALLGLLETVDEEPDIADAGSAGTAAQARLDLLSKNPRVVTCTLTADAPTTINQLVPGRITDFRVSTLPELALGQTRLQKLGVSVSQDSETVTLTTTPLGAAA